MKICERTIDLCLQFKVIGSNITYTKTISLYTGDGSVSAYIKKDKVSRSLILILIIKGYGIYRLNIISSTVKTTDFDRTFVCYIDYNLDFEKLLVIRCKNL